MNRFIALLFIAVLTFLAVLYVKRPDMLKDIWMWIVGLSAPVAGLLKRIYEEIKERIKKEESAKAAVSKK